MAHASNQPCARSATPAPGRLPAVRASLFALIAVPGALRYRDLFRAAADRRVFTLSRISRRQRLGGGGSVVEQAGRMVEHQPLERDVLGEPHRLVGRDARKA